MTETCKSVRVRIEGRVQGVGFRAWVERRAARHSLDGWVRNRRDGGVEAIFAGPAPAVDAMVAECHHGPRSASVTMVRVLDAPAAVSQGFTVGPTV
ncbi:MAG: acylphosphatase [Hyphomicrobiaceae bacterium]